MRKMILFLIILSGICLAGKAEPFSRTNVAFQARLHSAPDLQDLWNQIDAWPKGEMTNGLFCAMQTLQQSVRKDGPALCVYVANTTTNSYHFLSLPDEKTMLITLIDSSGKQVGKTDEDHKFSIWTQGQIRDWFEKHNHTHGVGFGVPPLFYVSTKIISIPQIFQIKEPGEYTLHLRMRCVKSGIDAAGKICFESTWLPEVTAKVQIRAEDIPVGNLLLNGQTNSPAK